MADKTLGKPIFGTDVSKPLAVLVEDLREQISKTRGQMSDVAHFKGWKESLAPAEGALTCAIAYLHVVKEEIAKAEARDALSKQTA